MIDLKEYRAIAFIESKEYYKKYFHISKVYSQWFNTMRAIAIVGLLYTILEIFKDKK